MKNEKPEIRRVSSRVLVPDSLYQQYPLEYFLDRVVKKTFTAHDGRQETMWVIVNAVQEDHLAGRLDNEPQLLTHLKVGDDVTVRPSEIIAVHHEKDEWLYEVRVRLAKGDFFNRTGGPARGYNFEKLYEMGLGPAQALAAWRDYGHRFVG